MGEPGWLVPLNWEISRMCERRAGGLVSLKDFRKNVLIWLPTASTNLAGGQYELYFLIQFASIPISVCARIVRSYSALDLANLFQGTKHNFAFTADSPRRLLHGTLFAQYFTKTISTSIFYLSLTAHGT